MNRPYQPPINSPDVAVASPWWYVWFYKLYWPAWWIGTALIAGSWFDIVSPTVGWTGFGLAGAAAFGSYVLPTLAGAKPEGFVVLDSRLLKTKGDAYHNAMERFRNGASLMYDGVAFGFRSNNEIACGVVADPNKLDDASATEIADHATSVFDQLVSECQEFASAVDGRTFRISIMSGFDPNAREICRVVAGTLSWQR